MRLLYYITAKLLFSFFKMEAKRENQLESSLVFFFFNIYIYIYIYIKILENFNP